MKNYLTEAIGTFFLVLTIGLTVVGGGGMSVTDNPALTSCAFPSLENVGNIGGSLNVMNNQVLSSLSLPALSFAGGGFAVRDNPELAQCLVDAIQAQVEAAQGSSLGSSSHDNNDACICEEVDGVLEASCD